MTIHWMWWKKIPNGKKEEWKIDKNSKIQKKLQKIIESGKGKRYQDRLDTCFNEILFLGGFFYLRYKCMVGFQVLNFFSSKLLAFQFIISKSNLKFKSGLSNIPNRF